MWSRDTWDPSWDDSPSCQANPHFPFIPYSRSGSRSPSPDFPVVLEYQTSRRAFLPAPHILTLTNSADASPQPPHHAASLSPRTQALPTMLFCSCAASVSPVLSLSACRALCASVTYARNLPCQRRSRQCQMILAVVFLITDRGLGSVEGLWIGPMDWGLTAKA